MARVWEQVGARMYDPFLAFGECAGMRSHRRGLLATARGRVLEIGAGTGLNVDHYDHALTELVLTEPTAAMATRLSARVDASGRSARVFLAGATELPVEDGSIDTVVSTMVLCTVPDAGAALTEITRVLRPGGRLLFCEHIRSDDPRLARWQDRLAGPWAAFAQGCRCDRRTLDTIAEHLTVDRVTRAEWRGMPALVRPLVLGEARR